MKMQIKVELCLQKMLPQLIKLIRTASFSFSKSLIYVCIKTFAELLARKAS